jgi:hydroxyethylthiazole kinase-like uncharacterized protein yjeF
MKEIERLAAENGLSYYEMMENAGGAAARFIMETIPVEGKKVLIFCGKGNNGGDGFVVARKLTEAGASCSLCLVDGEPKTQDAITNWKICRERNITIYDIAKQKKEVEALAKGAEIIVDAIYGTGFTGDLRENARTATTLMNLQPMGTLIFALDMPSGLSSDTGEADPDTVKADYTLAFHRYKHAHLMDKCQKWCGKLACLDIGIPQNIFSE